MSTRSRIGRRNDDGTIASIYCHFDGYPAGVGATLEASYTDADKVDALIALGAISSLRNECRNPPPGHSFDAPARGHTVAYSRDRGEDYTGPQTHSAHDWPDTNWDFLYLWDGSAWTAKSRRTDWRPLADVIADYA